MNLKYLFLALIAGLVVLAGIGLFADYRKIISTLMHANPVYLLFAAALQILAIACVFFRWAYVAEKMKVKVNFFKLFLISLVGITFSNLVPSGRVGGEPLRAHFLKKYSKKPTSVCLSTIIVERIFDAATFCVLSIVALMLAVFYWKLDAVIIGLLFVAFLVCILILFAIIYISVNHRAGLQFVVGILRLFRRFGSLSKMEKKLEKDLKVFSLETAKALKIKELWFYGFVYSTFVWVFDILRTYFIFLALGFNVSLLLIMGAIIVSALLGAIPVSPGGLGLVEGGMILFFISGGISLAVASTVTIIDRIISYWLPTFAGLGVAYFLGIDGAKK